MIIIGFGLFIREKISRLNFLATNIGKISSKTTKKFPLPFHVEKQSKDLLVYFDKIQNENVNLLISTCSGIHILQKTTFTSFLAKKLFFAICEVWGSPIEKNVKAKLNGIRISIS